MYANAKVNNSFARLLAIYKNIYVNITTLVATSNESSNQALPILRKPNNSQQQILQKFFCWIRKSFEG